MRTYVSPIGFNTTSVTRTILNYGVEADDTVVLIRPEQQTDDERAAEAIADVERMLQEIEPKISTRVRLIPHDDFVTAVMTCSEIFQNIDGKTIVNFGGGARDVLIPLTIATVAHAHEIDSVVGYSDIDGNVREWDLPRVRSNPSKGARETLALVEQAGEGVSIPELKRNRDLAKSTITRHVNQLETDGLVSSWTNDRTKHTEITLGGRLYLASRSRS